MNKILDDLHRKIIEACQTYRVERLDLFGSAAADGFDDHSSDFDFIVRFANPDQPGVAQRYFGLAAELERVLGRPVDLLTDRPIRNPYFAQSIAQSRQTIYAADQQEIPV
jgi:predicted nucleotidyltransferase